MNLKLGLKSATVLQLRAEFLDRKVRTQRAVLVTRARVLQKKKSAARGRCASYLLSCGCLLDAGTA